MANSNKVMQVKTCSSLFKEAMFLIDIEHRSQQEVNQSPDAILTKMSNPTS
jgi:hypothetical protein